MNHKDMALKLCRKWNKTKRNNNLTAIKKDMDSHLNFCSNMLKELKNKKLSDVKGDLEEAIMVYKLNNS